MITPSGKIGTIDSFRNYSTNGLILNVDFSNDYGFAGNTANDLASTAVKYSTPGGYVAVVSGSTAMPGYIDLDGSTDYLIAGSTLSAFAGLTAFTIDAWVKLDTLATRAIVSNNTAVAALANKGFALIILADGTPRINLNTGSAVYIPTLSGLTMSTGEWTNWFITVEETVVGTTSVMKGKVFKPAGVSTSDFTGISISTGAQGITSSNPIAIGRRSTAAIQYWDGMIGAVKIYNRVLPESEMNFNYNASKTRYGHT
jgi:hypothetical protein